MQTITERLEQNKQEIIKEYKGGLSTLKLGKKYNCNNGSIYLMLKKWNVETKSRQKFKGKLSDYEDTIVTKFLNDESIYKIAQDLGIFEPSITKVLKSKGYDTSAKAKRDDTNLLKDKKDLVIEMYNKGDSTAKIAEVLGHGQPSVWRLLNDAGIDTTLDTYDVDETFFEVIDSEEKAYVLGFMFSDGNVTPEGKLRISLQVDDAASVEKIKSLLKYEGPLFDKPPARLGEKWQKELCINRKKMVDDLIALGCVPAKSNILLWPKNLPDHLISHFLRGLLDGDGSIQSDKGGTVSFTGSKTFNSSLLNFLRSQGIVCQEYFRKSKPNSSSVMTTSIEESLKLLDFIYKDATVYMSRKYQSYLTLSDKRV